MTSMINNNAAVVFCKSKSLKMPNVSIRAKGVKENNRCSFSVGFVINFDIGSLNICLLYTSDAADE